MKHARSVDVSPGLSTDDVTGLRGTDPEVLADLTLRHTTSSVRLANSPNNVFGQSRAPVRLSPSYLFRMGVRAASLSTGQAFRMRPGGMKIARWGPPFVRLISHIRRRVAQPQMPDPRIRYPSDDIDTLVIVSRASGVIARVADHLSASYAESAGGFPSPYVHSEHPSARFDEAVAPFIGQSRPHPTRPALVKSSSHAIRYGDRLGCIMTRLRAERPSCSLHLERRTKHDGAACCTGTLYEHQATPGVGPRLFAQRGGTLLPSIVPATRRTA